MAHHDDTIMVTFTRQELQLIRTKFSMELLERETLNPSENVWLPLCKSIVGVCKTALGEAKRP